MKVRASDSDLVVRPPSTAAATPRQSVSSRDSGFAKELAKAQVALSFSKHAEERLHSSGEVLDGQRMAQLRGAVDAAMSKGARSTLVLMRGLAFVVAPQTGTVVTVVPEERMKDNVFTAIDSAVVVDRQ